MLLVNLGIMILLETSGFSLAIDLANALKKKTCRELLNQVEKCVSL